MWKNYRPHARTIALALGAVATVGVAIMASNLLFPVMPPLETSGTSVAFVGLFGASVLGYGRVVDEDAD